MSSTATNLTLKFSSSESATLITVLLNGTEVLKGVSVDEASKPIPITVGDHYDVKIKAAGASAKLASYTAGGVTTDQPGMVNSTGYDLSVYVEPGEVKPEVPETPGGTVGGDGLNKAEATKIATDVATKVATNVVTEALKDVKPTTAPAGHVGGYNEWRLDDVSTSKTDYAAAINEIEANIKKAGGGLLIGTAGKTYPILSAVQRDCFTSSWIGNGSVLDISGVPGGGSSDASNLIDFSPAKAILGFDAKWDGNVANLATGEGGQVGFLTVIPDGTLTLVIDAVGTGNGDVGLYAGAIGQNQQGENKAFGAGKSTITFEIHGQRSLIIGFSSWANKNAALKITSIKATSTGKIESVIGAITSWSSGQYGHERRKFEGWGFTGKRGSGVTALLLKTPVNTSDHTTRGMYRDMTFIDCSTAVAAADNAFCFTLDNIFASHCDTIIRTIGGSNMGEKLGVTNSTLCNSTAAYDGAGGGDVRFFNTSFDYNEQAAINVSQLVSIIGGHVENHYVDQALFTVNGGKINLNHADTEFLFTNGEYKAGVPVVAFGPNGGEFCKPRLIVKSKHDPFYTGTGTVI